MRRTTNLKLVIPLLFAGCASTAFEGQRDLAVMRLEEAEDAGASKQELEEVRETIDMAKSFEERAARDQEIARDDLEWARNELPAAESRIAELERKQAAAAQELGTVQANLQAIETERDDMLDRGLTADQTEAIVGVRRGVLLRRVTELELEEQTLAQPLELAQLDRETARLYVQAGEARLRAAQDRVALAGALYILADRQGKVIQAEAIREQRSEFTEQLSIEPAPSVPVSNETDAESETGEVPQSPQ